MKPSMYTTLILFCITFCACQVPESLIFKPCVSYPTCGECLSEARCAWCFQKDYDMSPRCDFFENLLASGCSIENTYDPSGNLSITSNEELSDAGAIAGSAIQLKPQKLSLSLRPHEKHKFKLQFRQAEDYPVDLYFLMDLTFSMKKHKDKLAELADSLAESMKSVTNNFKLGFGSFIDKVVMPYVDMVPARLNNPCREVDCSPPYGFRNHLTLNTNISLFVQEVATANVSGNLDNAEGGFDAIMQVITCKDKIGWNTQSRKIIIFATDSVFHHAGDGKLGGIVKPNDGLCHLSNDGYYTESVYQDYPSLSQINTKIVENKVNIIFAVPNNALSTYKQLVHLIDGSYVETLASDSSNIVQLIRNQYNKIRSTVELKDNASDIIQVKYSTKCLGYEKKDTHICEGLQVGTTVDFDVEIQATACPKSPDEWQQTLIISPVGIGEYVEININLLCECNCEKPEYREEFSSFCSDAGTYQCGICSCGTNHFGKQCECEGDDNVKNDKMALCIRNNGSDYCSNRGECVCGVCNCQEALLAGEEIYGDYCECDTFSCERDAENRVCGGPERGRCCDKCICNSGWTGDACDCTIDNSTCVNPEDDDIGKICSGHGECVCGQCKCFKDSRGRYGGPYCEDCNTCEGRCTELRECVQCQVFNSGTIDEKECGICPFQATTVEVLEEQNPDDRKCIFKDDDDCTFTFLYNYDENNNPVVWVKNDKDCPEKGHILWIAIGVTGGVFLIGLVVLLVIRFLIYLKDRRECDNFVKSLSRTEWRDKNTNPLFKNAVSKFENPTYSAQSS